MGFLLLFAIVQALALELGSEASVITTIVRREVEEESSSEALAAKAIAKLPDELPAAASHKKDHGLVANTWSALLETGRELKRRNGPAPLAVHSMFDFDWSYMRHWHAYVCCVVLFFAGLLCSAGGIGGGGIYVTVLMICGSLEVENAVPLSKSIVFFGACISMVLNMRKSLVMGRSSNTLIDFNICRLVVPSALLGTYMGVFLFRILPGWLILSLLTVILVCITITVCRQGVFQYFEEKLQAREQALLEHSEHAESIRGSEICAPAGSVISGTNASLGQGPGGGQGPAQTDTVQGPGSMRNNLTTADVCIAVVIETVVVFCSVFNFQIEQCQSSAFSGRNPKQVCQHPLLFFLSPDTVKAIAEDPSTGDLLQGLGFAVPFSVCSMALLYYTHFLVQQEGWCYTDTLKFDSMAAITGCLAGLVGIGGGLIFSPFFLMMGVEPAIAVATSSTCVLFTSSSTTLQYLFTDRIIMSLTLVYGTVNLLASYQGTRFVHFLQDKFNARRSYITAIVAFGVSISTVLSAIKLVSQLSSAGGSIEENSVIPRS